MATIGYYYLHTEGWLIYKPASAVEADPDYFVSSFVKRVWALDPTDRLCGWRIIVESLAAGARLARVLELTRKWGCDLDDLIIYLSTDADDVTFERGLGVRMLLQAWGIEPEDLFQRLSSTPKGESPDLTDFKRTMALRGAR